MTNVVSPASEEDYIKKRIGMDITLVGIHLQNSSVLIESYQRNKPTLNKNGFSRKQKSKFFNLFTGVT